MFGGADLSTVDPNPTVYSYGDSSDVSDISQIANVAGQWGTAIASIITGNPVQAVSTPAGVQTIGARGSSLQPSIFASNSGVLLLLAGVVVVILLTRK